MGIIADAETRRRGERQQKAPSMNEESGRARTESRIRSGEMCSWTNGPGQGWATLSGPARSSRPHLRFRRRPALAWQSGTNQAPATNRTGRNRCWDRASRRSPRGREVCQGSPAKLLAALDERLLTGAAVQAVGPDDLQARRRNVREEPVQELRHRQGHQPLRWRTARARGIPVRGIAKGDTVAIVPDQAGILDRTAS